ncbi:unnamed protein product [Cylindrotheca closterium]|uniref:RING-type domain-containing protein n=1 Tax=Cylindrotheca closterium TaxID=2856 RepID=A0AAD2FYA3_9STRA|nr:unnamed protein product [Cylindrotheca closterium]
MMNLMKSLSLLLICLITVAHGQDGSSQQPSPSPTIMISPPTANDPPILTIPTSAPQSATNLTLAPEDPQDEYSTCTNDPDWSFSHQYVAGWAKVVEIRGCDDDSVKCCHEGNLGYAKDHCCKCKAADYECSGNPDDDGFPIALQVLTSVSFVFLTLFSFKMVRESELRHIRQTMAARRQQQRESNHTALTLEEMNIARYELFTSKFFFQEVMPDKSNITVDGLRRSSMKLGDDNLCDEENIKTEVVDGDDSVVPENSGPGIIINDQTLSGMLSSWRKPAAKEECCICLECYTIGEVICAPMKTECIHVFHKGCMHEWVRRGNDKCPLCRVEILKD